MPLHPQIAQVLAHLPPADYAPPDVAVWRAAGEGAVPPPRERTPRLHAVEDAVVTTPDGGVPVRVYTPHDAGSYAVLVYFHGGAFFSGSLDTHDGVARALAEESGYRVVSVGYRLVPEHPFPAGLDDCLAVVRRVVERGDEFAWDGEHLAVAGDSSGATFAAVVAATLHDEGPDRITAQVLVYPSVDLDFDPDRHVSRRENAEGYGLETKALAPHNSFYLRSGADPTDPRVSPLLRIDLSGLPPALVITAEYDPLRDEGELYARRLRDAGVPTTLTRYEGVAHGFVQHFAWIPECYQALVEAGEFLRKAGS